MSLTWSRSTLTAINNISRRGAIASFQSAGALTSRATFASSSGMRSKKEFVVHIPDFADALERRKLAKQDHIAGATPLIESGQLSYFGVTMKQHPSDGQQPEINGSIVVIEAESAEDVRAFLDH